MQTFILQSENSEDLALLLNIAERLSINYYETDNRVFDAEIPDTSALYEGLGLEEDIKVIERLPDEVVKSSYPTDFELAKSAFGAWEEEEETLEELLNLLN